MWTFSLLYRLLISKLAAITLLIQDKMDTNDIENALASVDASTSKILPELLKLEIHNNSLLRVILRNQAAIYHQLDPSVSISALEESWIHDVKELTHQTKMKLLMKLSL